MVVSQEWPINHILSSQHQLAGIHMTNHLLVLKLLARLMTFWQSKTGGGWIGKCFTKLQNILEMIPDLHCYLPTTNSFKLFQYACASALHATLMASPMFSCLLESTDPESRLKNSLPPHRESLQQVDEKKLEEKTD